MTKKQLGAVALIGSAILWGPGPVVAKIALSEIPQFSLGFLRGVLATIIVFILFYRGGYLKIQRRDFWAFALAGLFGSVFNLGLFFYGIQFTSAMSAQAIFTTAPVINAIFSSLILKEKINNLQVLGVIIGMLGALTIASQVFLKTGKFEPGSLVGNFFIFLAAASWVGFIIVSKKLSQIGYHPITITSVSLILSMFCFLPLAFIENINNMAWMSSVGINGIIGIVYTGVFASVIAFLTFQTGLRLTSAFAAGVVIYLQPLVTTIVAIIVLNERLSVFFVLGALLIILGSFLATKKSLS